MDKLYSYILHYNHNTGLWAAFRREDYLAYWNNTPNEHEIYYHTDIKELIKALTDICT